MAALPAVLIGGGLLVLAAIVMSYRRTATPHRLMVIFILAVLASPGLLYGTRQIHVASFGLNVFMNFGIFSLAAALFPPPRTMPRDPTMRRSMVIFRVMLGIGFLLLGVIGGFIPILQGWIFVLLGLLVLFPKAKFTEKVLHKAEPKLPRIVRFLRRLGIGTEASTEE